MINQFIYKQLQKLEGSGALTLLWVGISSAIALTFFKVYHKSDFRRVSTSKTIEESI